MQHRFMVAGHRCGLGNYGTSRRGYDPEQFEGYVTLAPMREGLADSWDEMELKFTDEAEYLSYKLGEVYIITLTKEPAEVAAGAGYCGSAT